MTLRCHVFETVERAETRFICFRDTRTEADPEIGPYEIDLLHVRQGRFGMGYHFLIDVHGVIHMGRDLKTIGSHSKKLDHISVGVGFVGGKLKGEDTYTRTKEQEEAGEALLEVLLTLYPEAILDDQYVN